MQEQQGQHGQQQPQQHEQQHEQQSAASASAQAAGEGGEGEHEDQAQLADRVTVAPLPTTWPPPPPPPPLPPPLPPPPPPPFDTSIGPSGSPSGPKPIGAHPARDGAPSLLASGQSLSAAASVIPLTPPAAIGAPFSPTSSANGGWTSTAAADAAVDAGIPAEIPAEILAGVGGPTPPDSPEIQVAQSSSMAN